MTVISAASIADGPAAPPPPPPLAATSARTVTPPINTAAAAPPSHSVRRRAPALRRASSGTVTDVARDSVVAFISASIPPSWLGSDGATCARCADAASRVASAEPKGASAAASAPTSR